MKLEITDPDNTEITVDLDQVKRAYNACAVRVAELDKERDQLTRRVYAYTGLLRISGYGDKPHPGIFERGHGRQWRSRVCIICQRDESHELHIPESAEGA